MALKAAPVARRRRQKLRWWVALYALLIGLSGLWRLLVVEPPPLPEGMRSIELTEIQRGSSTDRTVEVAYRDEGRGEGLREAVLLLHGSPGSHRDFRGLLPLLATDRRVVAPDLPGFGASEQDLLDYSFDAHALYVLELLDRLEIQRAHLVGFSMGGGVALSLAKRAPERVRSITLLSAIGVQEQEWLGDYHLNRTLHGLQLVALWALRELTPHFGHLDRAFLGVPYARNFFDSDQRPLREALSTFEGPVHILHGENDPLVPLAAAEEHRRIAPQSRLELFAGQGHFVTFTKPELVAAALVPFLDEVEAGRAPTRTSAHPSRIALSQLPYDASSSAPLSGFALHAVMTLLCLATLASEDLACIGAGHLVAQGRIDLLQASLACFVGIYIGDLLLFLTGRLFGRRALRVPPLSWMVDERDVERSATWFARRGLYAIFLSRFMPGTRLPTYFAAGAVGASFWRFAFFFALAAGLWTPILVWIASGLSGSIARNVEHLRGALPLVLLAVIVLVLTLVKVVLPSLTWRGRRMLVGRYRRWRHWEFWPTWLFYPPLIVYLFYLGLVRHRRLTLFTAANPGIPFGGFVNESKHQILSSLDAPDPARMRVARWTHLPAGTDVAFRLALIGALQSREALGFPLVLKPDAGQRGSGVLIARDEVALVSYLETTQDDLVAQEFVPGEEYGIFYQRDPDTDRGEITSITVKQLARVVGDGRRSLERLILDDPRAVALARYYLRKNAADLDRVPAAGEVVAIGDLGTHARGAIFTDGAHLVTPELLAAVDRFSRRFEGFHFGRYDVRVPSEAHLLRGEGLVVLELNGVTSESTSIYDRRHGVLYAWATLRAQWRRAFAIGAANARRGAKVASLRAILAAAVAYRTRAGNRAGG